MVRLLNWRLPISRTLSRYEPPAGSLSTRGLPTRMTGSRIRDDFMDYWFRGKSTVVAYVLDRPRDMGMIGACYLKPNWPGRARHVVNTGFIVAPDWRNKGLGWPLGDTMLAYAKHLGYRSVIFNRARMIHEDFYCTADTPLRQA